LCLIGDRLTEQVPRTFPRTWWHSLVAVNNAAEFNNLYNSVVVADGDIDLTDAQGIFLINTSVVVCRGSIRGKAAPEVTHSLLCAGGDITLNMKRGWNSHLYAGGRVRFAAQGGIPTVKEKADLSFTGIRFFELSDVGVDAAAVKGGVRITQLDPRSPLAFYGLKVGDVITKLNGRPMTSVNEFRRHTRRSVVLRAGVFHLRRGDEDLSRIVYFDGLLASRK
jgi:hypothetical protein